MEWYLMVWKKYAEFDGRSRRKEYWMFTLFNLLAIFALGALAIAVGVMLETTGKVASENSVPFLFIPIGIYALAALIPSISAATRRFHDIGKSGWLLFLLIALGVIPVVGFITAIIQIVFLCQDSQPGANQYGPNPKFPEQGTMMYSGIAGRHPGRLCHATAAAACRRPGPSLLRKVRRSIERCGCFLHRLRRAFLRPSPFAVKPELTPGARRAGIPGCPRRQ